MITTKTSAGAPVFDFQGVGNAFGNVGYTLNGTITYTINGGTAQTVNTIRSGVVFGSVRFTDVFAHGSEPGVAVGDTVVLTAGTWKIGNYSAAPPASGSFQTFITDANGNGLTAVNGVSVVPEPSAWALLGAGAPGLVALRRRAARA